MALRTPSEEVAIASRPASNPNRHVLWFVVLLSCGVVFSWLSEPYPLSHAHWDSAVYLLTAKDYREGGLLPRLRARAPAVHDELMAGGYPREYWLFTRLGHIALLGMAVHIFGTDAASIGAIVGTYRLLFAAGLLVAMLFSVRVIRVVTEDGSASPVGIGAAISLALYLLSDIAGYMSGNLVSEVPALALLSLSAWTFVVAWERQSWFYAAISGGLGWMLYVARMESVWLYISFLVAFAVATWPRSKARWSVFMIAAAASLLLFLGYSWAFLPLTDPRLFAAATTTGVKLLGASGGGTVNQIVAANGLLWIGAAVAVPMLRTNKAARLGMAWLVLAMLPIAVAIGANYGTQTRMFTTLTPALLLLSTVGWSHVVARRSQGGSRVLAPALLLLSVAGVAISQPVTYARLHALPGMWRLQPVHEFLASKRFERIDYHLPELLELRRCRRQHCAAVHVDRESRNARGGPHHDHPVREHPRTRRRSSAREQPWRRARGRARARRASGRRTRGGPPLRSIESARQPTVSCWHHSGGELVRRLLRPRRAAGCPWHSPFQIERTRPRSLLTSTQSTACRA